MKLVRYGTAGAERPGLIDAAGRLRETVKLGCQGPNQVKAFTRTGMGPCQGRQCGAAVEHIVAAARGVEVETVGRFRVRPPVKPITLGTLATLDVDDLEQAT